MYRREKYVRHTSVCLLIGEWIPWFIRSLLSDFPSHQNYVEEIFLRQVFSRFCWTARRRRLFASFSFPLLLQMTEYYVGKIFLPTLFRSEFYASFFFLHHRVLWPQTKTRKKIISFQRETGVFVSAILSECNRVFPFEKTAVIMLLLSSPWELV